MPGLWEDVYNAKFPELRLRKSAASPKRKHAQQQLLECVLGFFFNLPSFSPPRSNEDSMDRAFQHVAKSLKKATEGSWTLNLQILLIIFLLLFKNKSLQAVDHVLVFFFED